MKFYGLTKKRNPKKYKTTAAQLAAERFENREIRSFEVEYVNALWHLDFHHGSIKILDANGEWRKPLLLCILDDHSRLVCHAQWYFDETAETLVHGFMQALQKTGCLGAHNRFWDIQVSQNRIASLGGLFFWAARLPLKQASTKTAYSSSPSCSCMPLRRENIASSTDLLWRLRHVAR